MRDEGVRRTAVVALGKLKDPRAVEPLIAALRDDNERVRWDAEDALIVNFNGLADMRVVTDMHASHHIKNRYPVSLLGKVPAYARGVLDLFHLKTAVGTYAIELNESRGELSVRFCPRRIYTIRTEGSQGKLDALPALWTWSGSVASVTEAVLDADLAALRTSANPDAVNTNPYLALFLAQIHKENRRSAQALEWVHRAQQRLPVHETAPRIVAGWIQAQALRQSGQIQPALEVIARIETELLPRLIRIERRISELPFESQTLALKGILLGDLDQRRQAIEAFYAAEDALKREEEQKWIPETTAQRVRFVINGYHATLLQAEGKAKAQQALDLMKQTPPNSRLEQEAELKALVARLKAALGDGDYELAQQLGERLALKHQPVPGQILVADKTRQAQYQQLQSLQQQIQQRLREQDIAEQAARQAVEAAQQNKDEDKDKEAKKKQAELAEAKTRGQQSRRELQQFLVQLKKAHPEVAALISAEPTQLRHWQARLQPHQRLVQYLLLDDQGWAFVASADTLEVVNLPVGRAQLREPIERYRRLLQTPAPIRGLTVYPKGAEPDTLATLGQQLRQHLLEPLRPHLNGVTHLLLIPNGPLHQLPFAALPWDNDQFLVQHVQISTLSSPSLLAALAATPPTVPPQLVALGNPIAQGWSDLPASEQEVKTLATLFPEPHPQPAIYLREAAQRNRLIGQDLNGKVLHLAVHGQAGTLDNTRLILSDGPLTVSEVWGLALERAPLVVLSACETALGEQLGGDEVVSLANGFIFAGAQAVVSSLWPVPDPPTRALMEEFYRQRDQGPAAALAAAQRTLIKDGHAPHHWAGFVVAGW